MSAQEREQAELEFTQTLSSSDPAYLAARMAFWDLGYKYEPRCKAASLGPDDVSSCECVKAGSNTAAICTHNDGYKCFMKWPLNPKWADGDAEEKNIADCNPTFPARTAISSSPGLSVPIAAAIVDLNHSYIIIGLAFLLLLSVWGHLRK